MARYLGWLANSFCFVLCCFFAANTVNAVIGSALGVASDETAAPPPTVLATAKTWDDRQVILSRNLFNASLLAPAGGAIEEDLEATRLPLTLQGTVSALEPDNAWAAIEERDTHANRVVRVNDEIRPGVTVLRIERRRVVLMENGAPRELALAEDEEIAASGTSQIRSTPAMRPRRAVGAPASRVPPGTPQPVAPGGDPSAASASPENFRNPATLFSQARILPKYENGQMVGVQVNAIKPGSLFETIGIPNGAVIRELNGIKIDSPEQSAKILLEFVDAKRFDLVVDDGSGPRPISYTPPD